MHMQAADAPNLQVQASRHLRCRGMAKAHWRWDAVELRGGVPRMLWYHAHLVLLSRLKPLLHEHGALVVGAASAATGKRYAVDTAEKVQPPHARLRYAGVCITGVSRSIHL